MTFLLRNVCVAPPAPVSTGAPVLILKDLNLSIQSGEQIALIGPSGAGKTTLLQSLACACRPASGSLQLFGEDPWALSNAARHALRRRIFLAPQTPPLPPRQRVVTAVLAGKLPQWSLFKAIASLIRPTDTELARQVLARLQLQDKLYARVDRLSGGERQRTSMARLLVSDARCFLVDEPLSALDPALARQTLSVLQQEAAIRGASLVCSLHQVDIARDMFPRLVGLRNGRIAFDLPGTSVTDEMIAALYQHSVTPAPVGRNELLPEEPLRIPRCF